LIVSVIFLAYRSYIKERIFLCEGEVYNLVYNIKGGKHRLRGFENRVLRRIF
jgi:hypothetical protein